MLIDSRATATNTMDIKYFAFIASSPFFVVIVDVESIASKASCLSVFYFWVYHAASVEPRGYDGSIKTAFIAFQRASRSDLYFHRSDILLFLQMQAGYNPDLHSLQCFLAIQKMINVSI
jgi:hypothetical protein